MSHLRDLPPVSGAIIWARQLENQLNTYIQRVEDVLGKQWEMDIEGKKLKEDGDSFRRKLNTDQIFEKWIKDTESRTFEVRIILLLLDYFFIFVLIFYNFTLSLYARNKIS